VLRIVVQNYFAIAAIAAKCIEHNKDHPYFFLLIIALKSEGSNHIEYTNMMMSNRNHKHFKMSTRSHTMPPRRRCEKVRDAQEQQKFSASLRAEVVTEDETLQKLFALEIEKAQVVTQQGFNAVWAYFLQSQAVTDAAKKREDEKKRSPKEKQGRKSSNPFRIAAGNLRKSSKSSRQIVPYKSDKDAENDEVNLALQRSVLLSEEEEEQLDAYNREYIRKAEKQRLVDSFLVSYCSKDECTDFHVTSAQDSENLKSRKKVQVKEITVPDCEFKRTSSSSSLQLRDVFQEELDSDDETSSTDASYTSSECSDCSSQSDCNSGREFRKIKETNAWLPWPKKNDGETLLVSFPSLAGNSSFLNWSQDAPNNPDESWERHRV
jgi:hypothetical protein